MTGAAAITIEIKLFAWLTKHLPPGATGQRAPLAIAPGTTAADVIDQLRIPPKEAHLVLVNGTLQGKHTGFHRISIGTSN